MEGKKILFINSVCGFGSTGKIVEQLANALMKQGNEVLVCYGRKKYSGDVPTYKICNQISNFTNVALARVFDNDGFGLKGPTKRLIKKIKEFNPDVINLHNLHGYYLNLEELFNYLATTDIKIVYTLHDCWSFTGHCSHFDYVGCNKYLTGCNHCPNKKEYPRSIFFDRSKRNYNKKKLLLTKIKNDNMVIVTPSKWLQQIAKNSFLGEYKVNVIYNGIDLQKFNYTDENRKKMLIAVASIWNDKKGYYDVVEIANDLDKFEVVMVGVNKKQLKELKNTRVKAIVRTNSQQELAELYQNALLFINPTYEDNFPTTNIEALACGTPIITYKTGGSVEAVNSENGFIVDKGNIKQMEATILKASKLEFNRQEISNQAKNLFNNEIMINNYLDCYENILNKFGENK